MKNIALLFCLFSVSASANWEKMPSTDFDLPPPPAAGSARDKADFRKLHEYQESRTDAECALAKSQEAPTFKAMFGGRDGVLTTSEVSKVQKLLTPVLHLSERIATYFKNKYKRPRPFNVDDTLEPCVKKPGGAKAYPSSHATAGFVAACVLAEIFERKASEIREHGKLAGELRVISGVHHPSDVEAAWRLGQDICDALLADEEFREELAELN